MFSILSVASKSFQAVKQVLCHQTFHTVIGSPNSLVKSGTPLLSQIRNVIRCHFPRPKEVKRVRVHGWEKRISTNNGRKVIMRRILKGRHVLSH